MQCKSSLLFTLDSLMSSDVSLFRSLQIMLKIDLSFYESLSSTDDICTDLDLIICFLLISSLILAVYLKIIIFGFITTIIGLGSDNERGGRAYNIKTRNSFGGPL